MEEKATTTKIDEKNPSTIIEEKMASTSQIISPDIDRNTNLPHIERSTIISTNINSFSNCSYYSLDNQCVFKNLSNGEILSKLKENIISTYPYDGKSVVVNGTDSFNFQVTNTLNEKNIMTNDDSIKEPYTLDIGTCEATLKNIYNISDDLPLIILKYYESENLVNEKIFQYELFHPITAEKLNLSYCENDTYNIDIQVNTDESFTNLIKKAKEQGYNLFDPDDPFYSKICTRYTSENGTDVLLDDRVSFYFNKIANFTSCPENCKLLSYSQETQNVKCECQVNNADIATMDTNHLIGSNTYKSFYSALKYSNYKVMICYNLVFNFVIFKHNTGSILTLVLFIIYFVFMMYYSYKGIYSLKVAISQIIYKQEKENEKNDEFKEYQAKPRENIHRESKKSSTKLFMKEEIGKKRIKYPPKKRKTSSYKSDSYKNKNTEHLDFIDSSKRKGDSNLKNNLKKAHMRKDDRKYGKPKSIILIQNNYNVSQIKDMEKLNIDALHKSKKFKTNKEELISDNSDDNFETISLNPDEYDNYELNNLDYLPACEYDRRSFFKTYWSVLLREHIGLMTFFARNDHNLFYVKINRFIIQFATTMAMNGLFFSDESMHYLYVNNGEYSFVQKIPQMLISLVIEHILEVILCFLSLTDSSYYDIKEIKKEKLNVESKDKIFNIIKCVRRKLIAFHIFTFLLFLFYWYFISAFCAVYPNTEGIFLRDTITSYFTAMLDPFIIYALTTILRCLSLCKCCKKKASFVYNISQFLPIF